MSDPPSWPAGHSGQPVYFPTESPYLSLKQIMDLHSENVQTGLPRSDPDAALEPATTEIIDLDYEFLDVESQILDVAATLAVQTAGITTSRDYLLCPVQLSSFTPEKQLSLLQAHLSRLQKRLAPDSAPAPRHHETDQILREGSGQQTRVASEPASQPATIGESNALASVPVPPSIIACAKKPRKPTFFNHGGATASAPGAPEPNVPPLPPCTFADARSRTSEPQVGCLWNFLVTACQTRLDVYKSRTNTVKSNQCWTTLNCAPASFIPQQKAISLVVLGSSRGIRCFQQPACRMQRRQ